MLTRPRHGYMKIELMNGQLIPGEGTSEDKQHLPDSNWVALYQHPADAHQRHLLGRLAHLGNKGPVTVKSPTHEMGIGAALAQLNFETGRADRAKPFELRVLKEGFGSASGSILKSMFANIRIKKATFDFTKQNAKGEEVMHFQVEIQDGAFSEWEVLQEGGGSTPVETLEFVSIVASKITFLKEAVWAETDGEKRVFGGYNYEERKTI